MRLLLLIFFLPTSLNARLIIPKNSGACSRDMLLSYWSITKKLAQEGDVTEELDTLESFFKACNKPIPTAGELNQRQIKQLRRRGFQSEYEKHMEQIRQGN